jgi:restriction endonuclease S subunit
VIPSRGDYYRSWVFEGADEPVFALGQLNVITPAHTLDAHYLAWYLNQKTTQSKLDLILTGTSIQALTKVALLAFMIEVPPLAKQRLIADLDRTTQQIGAIRHRLNELDKEEIGYLTSKFLHVGGSNHG